MGYVLGLKCKECGRDYPKIPHHVCEFCFGPLEVVYDFPAIKKKITRSSIEAGPPTMWRYRDLLPIDGDPQVGHHVGFTPLIRAKNLGDALGLTHLYIKNDGVSHPTFSFKDRVVAVATTKALEFDYSILACASTGNLANSVAAHATEAGMGCYVFIPHDLEMAKILGTLVYGARVVGIEGSYDDVNRLCSEIAAIYPWAFVNINIRPYYGDGSKTFGYEIAEQLGWRAPDNIVVPVAGSSLIVKIWTAFQDLKHLELIDRVPTRVFAAQATGCSPVTTAIKSGADFVRPVKPNTIAKSIAIGNPADGYYGLETVRKSGGYGEDVSDDEVIEGILLLAQTEGIFTETAGGVTIGVTRKLVEQGRIGRDEVTVLAITGNGLKTQEVLSGKLSLPPTIKPRLNFFQQLVDDEEKQN